MEIVENSQRKTTRARADYFTGSAWLDAISASATADAPEEKLSRLRAFRVSFEPGARTAWHTHPNGQVLHVLFGVGRVQSKGGPVRTVNAGDTVIIQAGELHWHGASPGHSMVHLAMQIAADDGTDANWFQQVTDAEYNSGG